MIKSVLLVLVVVAIVVGTLVLCTPQEIVMGIESTMAVTGQAVYVVDDAMPGLECVSYNVASAVGATPAGFNPCKGGR